MSNQDSFIDEVTEEVRRDHLFKLMRRYGWIGIALVVLLVGGAAWNEWRKASDRASAQALGDSILTAMSENEAADRATGLQGIAAEGDAQAVLGLLIAAEAQGADAASALQAVADNATLPRLYRDLATLKLALLPGRTADERVLLLEPLTAAGAPFRVLAEEQIAIAEVEQGNPEAAMTRLQALLIDDEASEPLRRRASQLIVALGGTPAGA
ncbi:hypothetical protein [Aliiroseovarius subalbicans]|uniref:hypothetical protein n=1 Tax=Aliiroseovarius subalbicans TaxID=2925840 RepID=UPI001F584B96|nr:hypothetical protein [uncultured Aliiroseovarius sp.]MCI2398684.1 hypothetical protein [Aliiroseovarius subalbicans]